MIRPKAAYFFYYAATASLLPFIALYYAQVGLSASQIGLLSGILPLVTLVSAPLWGGLADATRRHHALLLLAIAGTMAAVLALSRTASLSALIPIVMLNAFFMAPIIPLVDSTVLTMLGERRSLYGRQRLWGAIGWGITAPVAGWLMDRVGMTGGFGSYVLMMFGCFVVAISLPVGRSHISGSFRRGVRGLLGNWQWLVFLASILIGGIVLSIEMSFLFLYLNSLGASKALMGLSLAVATISELPVWFYSNRMLERFGTRQRAGDLAPGMCGPGLRLFIDGQSAVGSAHPTAARPRLLRQLGGRRGVFGQDRAAWDGRDGARGFLRRVIWPASRAGRVHRRVALPERRADRGLSRGRHRGAGGGGVLLVGESATRSSVG